MCRLSVMLCYQCNHFHSIYLTSSYSENCRYPGFLLGCVCYVFIIGYLYSQNFKHYILLEQFCVC
jgi:hypothetical protein